SSSQTTRRLLANVKIMPSESLTEYSSHEMSNWNGQLSIHSNLRVMNMRATNHWNRLEAESVKECGISDRVVLFNLGSGTWQISILRSIYRTLSILQLSLWHPMFDLEILAQLSR